MDYSKIGDSYQSFLCAVPSHSSGVMCLHIDHELQQKILESVAKGHLRRRSQTELLADIIGPVVRAAHIALDEISRSRLHADPMVCIMIIHELGMYVRSG